MNNLLESQSIEYKYKYYKQVLYRRYKREGIDGAVVLFAQIREENPLLFRILKKQYRSRMSDEQSAYLNKHFEEILSNHKDINDPAILAVYTMAALYVRSDWAGPIIRHAAILSNNSRDFIKEYNQEVSRLQELSFLKPMDAVQFLLYKYIYYKRRALYDDVYYNYQPIIIETASKNKPLNQLFTKRIEDREFKYLDFLINSLQNTTLEAAGVDEETLFNAGRDLEKTNQYTHYVTFCVNMFLRKSEDPAEKLQNLEYCCNRLKEVLKTIKISSVYFADYLKMIHSIRLDEQHAAQYIDNYEYQEIHKYDRYDGDNRKWTEDVFEILLMDYPELVLPFIEKTGNNNIFAFNRNRDYEFSKRRTVVLCADWVRMLKEYYTTKEIIDIFMNSPLRSCYPITLFLKNLFFHEEKEVEIKNDEEYYHKDLKKLLNKYEFTGVIYKELDSKEYELTAYSFRNDNCLIRMPVAVVRSAGTVKFSREKMKKTTVLVSEPVRFKLKSIHFVNNKAEVHRLVAILPENHKVNRFQKQRGYSLYL